MTALLPVGTYVRVDDPGCWDTAQRRMVLPARTYIARIVGYDVFRSKYEVGLRYGGWGEWRFLGGGDWPAPGWCTEITEAEALAVPS